MLLVLLQNIPGMLEGEVAPRPPIAWDVWGGSWRFAWGGSWGAVATTEVGTVTLIRFQMKAGTARFMVH